MIDVVVEVRGGLIAEIYCDHPEVRVIAIDWDEKDSPERAGQIGFDWSPCAPVEEMPSDTREQYAGAIPAPDDAC